MAVASCSQHATYLFLLCFRLSLHLSPSRAAARSPSSWLLAAVRLWVSDVGGMKKSFCFDSLARC